MINLILAIICSSGNSLIMKFHEKHSENRVALLLMNYVMAVIFGGALVVKEIAHLDFHRMGMTPLLGMVNGFFYVSAFLLLQLSIRKNGATVSASLSHMGLLIPVLLSILLFREYPGSTQWGGVILGVALFINCINWTVLHEKLTRRDYIGMALSMGAIVLLNL